MSQWEVPPPGSQWSTPGAAPPPGFPTSPPTGPPTGPPAGPAVGARPEKQLRARPLQLMSIIACIGLGIAGIGALLTAGSVGERAALVDEADFDVVDLGSFNEERAFFDDLELADQEVAEDTVVYGMGTLLAGIPWVIWQRRFVRNSQPLGGLTRSIGWGSWGWFVPLANLYFPQAQLAEAARASDPMRARKAGSGAASPFVYLWWVVYTASGILAIGADLTQPDIFEVVAGTARLSDFQRADQVSQMGYVGQGIAAGLAIGTVLACTARQRHLFHAIGVRA